MASDIRRNELYEGDLGSSVTGYPGRVCFVCPGRTELYLPVADKALEMAHLERAELRADPVDWGHVAVAAAQSRRIFRSFRAAVQAALE